MTTLRLLFLLLTIDQLQQVSKDAIRYESLSEMELIILDDLRNISSGLSSELEKYVKSGGNLLIFPSLNAEVLSYNQLLGRLQVDRLDRKEVKDRKVSRINDDAFVFSGVY